MKRTHVKWCLLGVLFSLGAAIIIQGIADTCIAATDQEQVIQITAKKYEFSPDKITLKKGVPVILEFTSLDRKHGFYCPGLGVRTDIMPDKPSRIRLVPDKTGSFPFHCDVFCGLGHGAMTGTITVEE